MKHTIIKDTKRYTIFRKANEKQMYAFLDKDLLMITDVCVHHKGKEIDYYQPFNYDINLNPIKKSILTDYNKNK